MCIRDRLNHINSSENIRKKRNFDIYAAFILVLFSPIFGILFKNYLKALKNIKGVLAGDYCIIQDADLELDPQQINDLLEPVLKDEAEIVYGSRFINSKKKKKESILNRIANKLLTALGNFCFGVRLTDMQTCYKLIPTKIFKQLDLKENRFAFDPEVTAKLAKNKSLRWKEVPINYNPRTVDEGKKIRWRDGFRALFSILRYGLF